MNPLKRLWGGIIKGVADIINVIFIILIFIVEGLVNVIVAIGRGFGMLISMGGCLVLFLLGPAIIAFMPVIILAAIILIGGFILGKKLVSMLKYAQYATTEYLYDRADYYREGKKIGFDNVGEYGKKYERMKAEEERKRQEERRREQNRMWEEQFRQWYQYQQSQQQYRSYGGQNGGQYRGYQYQDPTSDFIKQYEEACRILELPTDTDEYQVKLAYRKMAKRYHPDINKSPDATQKFQKINDAYSLLSSDNIERYKRLKNR